MTSQRTWRHRNLFLALLCTLLCASVAHGQGVWGDPGNSTFQARCAASHYAVDPLDPGGGCSTQIPGVSLGAEYNAWGWPDDCATVAVPGPCRVNCPGPQCAALAPTDYCQVNPSTSMIPLPDVYDAFGWAFANSTVEGNCGLWGAGNALATYTGVGTSELTIAWHMGAQAGSNCECTEQVPPHDPPCNSTYQYCARGSADMDVTIAVTVDGVPPGTPVLIHAEWYSMVHNSYDPEDEITPDDPASITVDFVRVGASDLVPPNLVMNNNGGLLLLPPGGGSGVIPALGGDTIEFTIGADATAAIEYEPKVCYQHQDRSEATVSGKLLLSIDGAPSLSLTPPYAYAPGSFAEFSLDIGSDAEMSDPNADGDEVFDPGDLYPWGGAALGPGGADGIRDDALIFGADYWPQAPDGPPPVTGALTCQSTGAPIDDVLLGSRFDLDGSDALGQDLVPLIPPGPLPSPIFLAQHNIGCVYRPDNLVVSFDDDDPSHYIGSTTGYCGIPVDSSGEFDSRPTFGTTQARDEILGIVGVPSVAATVSTQVIGTYPVLDEANLHIDLDPNPDFDEADDDDVDALDAAAANCDWHYFCSDHEATGQSGGFNLDAGGIYRVNPLGGSPVKVVDEFIHLGLDEATDIDAFEFVWLPHPSGGGDALALLFSVSLDDWLTVGIDEDGGLNPRQLYGSFLDGTYFDYLGYETPGGMLVPTPFDDDVDALTASPVPFVTSPCSAAASAVFADGFESYPAGQAIAGSGGWDVWPDPLGTAGDVSTAQAATGTQSARIIAGDDVVQQLSTNPMGKWTVTVYTYVASTATGVGYFVLLNDYDPAQTASMPSDYWSVQLKFDADNASVTDDFSGGTAPLLFDQWFPVQAEIDFNNDQLELYYAGTLVHTAAWTRGLPLASLNLAAVYLYGQSISEMYFDDVSVWGLEDCNGNLVADICDIAAGTSADCQGNGRPDECETPFPDFDGDGDVDTDDYAEFYGCLTGSCLNPPCVPPLYSGPCCALADGDSDGDVDLEDGQWFQGLFTGP